MSFRSLRDWLRRKRACVLRRETPSCTLIHELEIGEDGRVKHASIITPTVHNLGDTESSVRTLADLMAEQGASEEEIRLEVGKLVRAYDPCLSCSVH